MHHFTYKGGVLHAENVPLITIADEVGTPFYCYSTATIRRHYTVFHDALDGLDALVCFSAKANGNIAVLKLLADMGAGCDVVSGGELERALAAGMRPEDIIFSGVGKTDAELRLALDRKIGQINVESEAELQRLSAIASECNATAPVALRVNPDVHAKTHEKIATGRKEDKFGVAWTEAPRLFALAKNLPGLDVVGVAVHIGSQITDLAPFEAAFTRVAELVRSLKADGYNIRTLDLGGGLGVPYDHDIDNPPSPAAYGEMVKTVVGGLDCRLLFEPGRVIVGNAGILVTRVVYVKPGETKRFVIVDAGMNDLIRPAMYGAHHDVLTVTQAHDEPNLLPADVVGPVCESGDRFAAERPLPAVEAGDLIALTTAGAYGAVMASTYNTRPLVPEVLVDDGRFAVIRRRPAVQELWALESLPDWMA